MEDSLSLISYRGGLELVRLFAGRKLICFAGVSKMADVKKSKNSKWHWNCASALCTLNTFRTEGITYYTLPSDPELQKGYAKVLMNENVNWKKHVICGAHWSTGKRED